MNDAERNLLWRGPDPALCPIRIQSSIEGFVRGLPVGSFVRAVLCNDLLQAVIRADPDNLRDLPHIVAYVRDRVPFVAIGSAEKVDGWILRKRDEEVAARRA